MAPKQEIPPPSAHVVYDVPAGVWDAPEDITAQDLEALVDSFAKGEPAPPNFTFLETEGHVICALTGLLQPNGAPRASITIRDNELDLDEAYVYVEGQLVATATRTNGRIEDIGNGLSEATMDFWLPPSMPATVEARWKTASGLLLSHEITAIP